MWQASLQNQGYNTIYFNAWETDYLQDPLIAILGELKGISTIALGFDGGNIENIIFPEGLLSIYFSGNTDGLKSITLPKSLVAIKYTESAGFADLETINFRGDKAQFKNIKYLEFGEDYYYDHRSIKNSSDYILKLLADGTVKVNYNVK